MTVEAIEDRVPTRVDILGVLWKMVRLPGVYAPQADSVLLAEAIVEAGVPPGVRVADLCTGTGAQAVAAARAGAGSVLAVDVSRRALVTAWFNATLRRLPVRVRRGGLVAVAESGPFDVLIANPPYVPSPRPVRRPGRCWDAGPDGRMLLDPLCTNAADLLTQDGFLLLVQSEVSGVETSLKQLRAAGLKASVVARTRIPFGPVMRERAGYLRELGLIGPEQTTEEVVVLRADRLSIRRGLQ
jgi:release factor glutamine methyltransferase